MTTTDTTQSTREDDLLAIAAIIERDRAKYGWSLSPEGVAFALILKPLTTEEAWQVHSLLGDTLA
jgi:hypothetical protein